MRELTVSSRLYAGGKAATFLTETRHLAARTSEGLPYLRRDIDVAVEVRGVARQGKRPGDN